MKRLSLGKIPIRVLDQTVLKLTGFPSDRIATPPLAGLDFAAVKLDGKFMIVSADPVTGVVEDIGRYAISVSANDVATSGNRPEFAECVILLPEDADAALVRKVASQMHHEAKKLRISIVGGHTEVTPGLDRPIVIVTAFGFVGGYVSSRDAREGDTIMMTKTAGLEGTAVLSGAPGFLEKISVVDEAVAAYGTGFVHAMHDCTEGGVLGAVYEMSLASGLGFELRQASVPVATDTLATCRKFSIDPLKLIGSGALLISVEPGKEADVAKALESICDVTSVGRFTRSARRLVLRDGRILRVREAPEDELWRVLGRASGRRKRL